METEMKIIQFCIDQVSVRTTLVVSHAPNRLYREAAVTQRHVSTVRSETVGLHDHSTISFIACSCHIFDIYSPLKQARTLILHHDIRKPSGSWYEISPRLPCNRSKQLKHQQGTHFSIFLLCLLTDYSSSVDIQWK